MHGITRGPLARLGTLTLGLTIVAAACGAQGTGSQSTARPTSTATAAASASAVAGATTDTKAAKLRTDLGLLLQEHVYLTGRATNAALGGRDDEFKQMAGTLDENTTSLGKAIGSVYGEAADKRFGEIWRAHIGFFVNYTQSAAKADEAGKKKAQADLDGYRADFDAFITGANPNVPKGAIAEGLKPHVAHLSAMIDAQAAKDQVKAFGFLKQAAEHAPMLGDVLAGAIVKQFPDKFAGKVDGSAAGIRTALSNLLQEHVYLTSAATGGALGGRTPEFEQAAATLDKNTIGLGKAIGSVYGDAADKRFLEIWRAHIGFFVNYTQATAKGDAPAKAKALADLDGYRADFDAFITGANPNVPKGAIAEGLKPHVSHLAGMIDAQGKKDLPGTDKFVRQAAEHAPMLGDILAAAIVKQFPAKFTN